VGCASLTVAMIGLRYMMATIGVVVGGERELDKFCALLSWRIQRREGDMDEYTMSC
jgi:hypothetical protein